MRLVFLIAFVLLNSVTAFSQHVTVLGKSERTFPREKTKAPFYYLEDGIDTTALVPVATLQVKSAAAPSLEDLFDALRKTAKKMGANAFKLQTFDHVNVLIVAGLYRVTENQINRNNDLKPQNTVYIFAGEPYEKASYYSFEINGDVKSIRSGTYFKYELKEGEQVKLRKGMITGTIMWVKWKPNQLPNYYSIQGFSDEPVVKRTTVSEPSKPGKFHPVDSALGAFLCDVMEEKKE